ncbi:PREDICTED: sodium/hydrogen exchanger 9B1 isoform X2 [Condylura cristata]|uniref:sodium/hydrogen exchanger 9B1 isoform X2 n=1 Tax=Condylura cristata TaxID=143302 RepID=UPI00064311DD|nr:PREDICTED: sodium/hydrogen exchanger 9B1 isoform X2 [Condylura cristata]
MYTIEPENEHLEDENAQSPTSHQMGSQVRESGSSRPQASPATEALYVPQDRLEARTSGLSRQDHLKAGPSGLSHQDRLEPRPSGLSHQDRLEPRPSGLSHQDRLEPRPSSLRGQDHLEPRPSRFKGQDRLEPLPSSFRGQDHLEPPPPGFSPQEHQENKPPLKKKDPRSEKKRRRVEKKGLCPPRGPLNNFITNGFEGNERRLLAIVHRPVPDGGLYNRCHCPLPDELPLAMGASAWTDLAVKRAFLVLSMCVSAVLGSHRTGLHAAGGLCTLMLTFSSGVSWSKEKVKVQTIIAKTWNVFQPLLFGLVGWEVSVASLRSNAIGICAASITLALLVRISFTFAISSFAGFNFKEKIFIALAWVPKATVQAVLGPLALETARASAPNLELYSQHVMTVAFLAILITAPNGALFIGILGPKLLTHHDPSLVKTDWSGSTFH